MPLSLAKRFESTSPSNLNIILLAAFNWVFKILIKNLLLNINIPSIVGYCASEPHFGQQAFKQIACCMAVRPTWFVLAFGKLQVPGIISINQHPLDYDRKMVCLNSSLLK